MKQIQGNRAINLRHGNDFSENARITARQREGTGPER